MSTQVQTPHRSAPADETLFCAGCRLRFDAALRRPLVLPCLHSFCETCIRSFAGPKHDQRVTCSLCRTTTKLNRTLPVNYAILEMVSGSGQARPITVIANSRGPLHPCNGPTAQYAGEGVTVIPVHKRELDGDLQPQSLVSIYDGDDRRQQANGGTTSINIGQSRRTDDGHVTTTSSSMTSLPMSSSEPKGSRSSSSMVVTMTSSSALSPNGSSCSAAPQPHGPCSSSQAMMTPSMAPGLISSTVTSLSVKSSSSTSHSTSSQPCDSIPAPAAVDLCSQCRVHPAMLTVASATEMSSQKLCSSCHAFIQQHSRLDAEWENPARNHVPLRRNLQNTTSGSEGPPTTVIKVLDEHHTGVGSGVGCGVGVGVGSGSACSCTASHQPAIVKGLAPPIPSVVLEEGHRGSIHVDGKRTGLSVLKSSEVSDPRPPMTESLTTASGERSKESDQKLSVKQTQKYVACSKFNLGTQMKRPETLNADSSSRAEQSKCPDVDEAVISREEIYRPLPFNPSFADSGQVPSLEPPPLPPPPSIGEPMYPAVPSEKQCLDFQGAALPGGPVYPYPVQGPPRYEEIVSQGAQSADSSSVHSAAVRCVNAFGKYGELATQPGAFRSPTRINASQGGVVVVTDSAHRTVQAFNAAGECLALIRVNGDSANGCSCYEKKKLIVGTNSGIQIYDFNGTLKKTIPLGLVINTVSTFRGQGFIAVQPKALAIFRGPKETLIRTLKDRSKPGPVRQPVPFDSIADAAVNSQEDIVVLDGGAASGLGMILIMSDDGYLKSSIVPGSEPCGVLRQPQAIAVDKAHNVIVSDSANRRILLFAANGKFQRLLMGPGNGGADLKTWPVGLDIGDDGRLFVVAKGDKFAEIRVFTYH